MEKSKLIGVNTPSIVTGENLTPEEKRSKNLQEMHVQAKKKYNSWKRDKKIIEEFKDIVLVNNEILVEIFSYIPDEKANTKLIGLSGENLSSKHRRRIYPIARVISLGITVSNTYKEFIQPGDIISLRDDMLEYYPNENYLKHLQSENHRPLPSSDNRFLPPPFINKFQQYYRHKFVKNKFQVDESLFQGDIADDLRDSLFYAFPPQFIVAILEKNI